LPSPRDGGRTVDLTLKYGGRLPRYTRYPTAAHFTADRERLTLTPAFGFAAELDLRILTAERIDAAVALGLSRASLGRASPRRGGPARDQPDPALRRVERAATRLRAAGVRSVDFDLMYGRRTGPPCRGGGPAPQSPAAPRIWRTFWASSAAV
jgi:hypothetical protein